MCLRSQELMHPQVVDLDLASQVQSAAIHARHPSKQALNRKIPSTQPQPSTPEPLK